MLKTSYIPIKNNFTFVMRYIINECIEYEKYNKQ